MSTPPEKLGDLARGTRAHAQRLVGFLMHAVPAGGDGGDGGDGEGLALVSRI